jgi:DMSO/TMAO reductase YedYZ molybdopterin-dependent catalytic subunit
MDGRGSSVAKREPGLWVRGFAQGVAAGVAATLVLFAYRFATGMPTPEEALAERMVRLLPYPVFALILGTLQHAAKPLGFGMAIAVSLLGFGLGGVLYAQAAAGIRTPRLILGLMSAAVVWVFLTFVFLPFIQGGILGVPLTTVVSAPALPMALGSLVYGLLLAVMRRTPSDAWSGYSLPATSSAFSALRAPAAHGASPISRRDFLQRSALVLLAAAAASLGAWGGAARARIAEVATGALRLLTGAAPQNGMPPEITPTGQFYQVSKNLPFDPTVDVAKWSLEVTGLVAMPLKLSYAEFVRAAPSVERYHTLECIANEVGGDLIGSAKWTGLRMKDILDLAHVDAAAKTVIMRSADNYSESVPLDVATDPATLLAYQMNGAPLPQTHGAPVRVLIANRYGMKQPKWLTSLEVANPEFTGYWEQQGRSKEAIVKVNSAFRVEKQDGAVVRLGGWAFAGSRGISKVEISADGGKTWSPATVKEPLDANCWQFWAAEWRPPAPGEYALTVRAVDGTGVTQPEMRKRLPDGAEGLHEIRVRFTG